MKHEKIDDKARVWILTRGDDGKLHEQLDAQLLTEIGMAESSSEVADMLIMAAGEMEVAETRLW